MKKKFLIAILTLGLVIPAFVIAQQRPADAVKNSNPPAAAQPSAPAAQPQEPQTEQPRQQTRAERRSYQRETHSRRHHGISKKEWIFLGAVAGTSMGVGAIAGGAHGLAIGSIVGGWGAYAAHRMWHWIR